MPPTLAEIFNNAPAARETAYREARANEATLMASDRPVSRPNMYGSTPPAPRSLMSTDTINASEWREALASAAGYNDAALRRGRVFLERRNGVQSALAEEAASRRAAEIGAAVVFE